MKRLALLFRGIWLLALQPGALCGQSIHPEGLTTIHLVLQPATSVTLPLTAQVYHLFPAYDVAEVHDSLSAQRKQVWLRCPVLTTQTGYLLLGKDRLTLFMIPGDTIHITISASSAPLTYTFGGTTRAVQAYYLTKKRQFPLEPGQLGMNAGIRAKTLIQFKQQLDRLTQAEIDFWRHYQSQHPLPHEFARFESDAIRYMDAFLRLYMIDYHTDELHKKPLPAGYFDFLQKAPIQNKSAQYTYEYLLFLDKYMHWKVRSAGFLTTSQAGYQRTFEQYANQVLGKDLGGFFQLWTLSGGLQDNPENVRTALNQRTFPAQYGYLLPYLRQRAKVRSSILDSGTQAPAFFLTDTRDSLVSLSQFRGQVVYLCFWFASCGVVTTSFPLKISLLPSLQGNP